jgi:enterochelin esterase-like enzyme
VAAGDDTGPDRSDKAKPSGGPFVGELLTHTLDYDGGRQVTVYLPPRPPEAVVFAGDGQLIAPWGASLEAVDVPPTMIVGAHRVAADDELPRLREYSPAIDSERFEAHEHFFVHTLGEWVSSRFGALPPERTAVAGVSAGAELALAMGMRHPGRYRTVFAASPGGGYRPPAAMPARLPRAYLTAGTLEPFFLENASRWADALRGAGADLVMTECLGDHGDPFWQAEFVRMVRWAFGPGAP